MRDPVLPPPKGGVALHAAELTIKRAETTVALDRTELALT